MPERKRWIAYLLLANGLFWCLVGLYYFVKLPDYGLDAALFIILGGLSFWRGQVLLTAPSALPGANTGPTESRTSGRLLRKRLMASAWLLGSVASCLLGQYYLSNLPAFKTDAAIFYAIGIFSFWRVLAGLNVSTTPAPRPAAVPLEPVSPRWRLSFVSAGLALLAYLNLAGNQFTRAGVLAWLGAMALFVLAWLPHFPLSTFHLPPSTSHLPDWKEGPVIRFKWRILALLAILALAAFFRLYRLDQVPPEMTSDHIEKLLDIYDLSNGARPIYFERNTGREPFQFYWAFTVMRVLGAGITFYGLKLANALIGIVTILGIYLLGRELAGANAGLLAALFASVMQWAESITRMALRFPYAPLGTAFALWAILRALRSGRRSDYILAGLIFGAGFYGYTAYRVMPLALAAALLVKLAFEWPRSWQAGRQLLLNVAVFGCAAALVFLPLGRYWRDNPEMFWYRSASRVQGEYGAVAQDIGLTLANNTLRALGMFNVVGDAVWANTVPNKPTLDEVGGALLVLGTLAAAQRVFRRRDFPLLIAVVSGVILLLPSILSLAFPNENPSVVRAAGAMPVIAVLVGLGLHAVARALARAGGPKWGKWLATLALVALLATSTLVNYRRYFVEYLHAYQLSSQNSSEMAEAMRGFMATGGDLEHIVIRAWPYWVDTRALALLMGQPAWQDTNVVIDRIQDLARLRQDPAPQMYILHVEDKLGLAMLQTTFPSGYAALRRSPIEGHDFVLFLVPMRQTTSP